MRVFLLALSLALSVPAFAATQRCAQVSNGVVINVINADPATFIPSDGSIIVASATSQIGDTYSNGVFTHAVGPPTYPTVGLDFLAFMALFTSAEQTAIVNSTDARVKLFNLMAAGASQINLADPLVIGGVNYLASVGLIASNRVAVILSGAPPS